METTEKRVTFNRSSEAIENWYKYGPYGQSLIICTNWSKEPALKFTRNFRKVDIAIHTGIGWRHNRSVSTYDDLVDAYLAFEE